MLEHGLQSAVMPFSDEKASEGKHLRAHLNGIAPQKDVEDLPAIDHVAEAELIRKLDIMIVPPVMLLYLFSFLDRVCYDLHRGQY